MIKPQTTEPEYMWEDIIGPRPCSRADHLAKKGERREFNRQMDRCERRRKCAGFEVIDNMRYRGNK